MTDTLSDLLRSRLDGRLAEIAAGFGTASPALGRAMEDAALSSGKRFRGVLLLMAAEAAGGACDASVDAAAALEIVHSASLVFDDLPCMDDASLRRGKPATHVAHGESRAVLAGIALITEAMRVLAGARGADPAVQARLVAILAHALGPLGLCAGQDLDLSAEKTPDGVQREQDLKTGVLFIAGLEMLAALKGIEQDELEAMIAFGRQLGRVFQSYDDLLDLLGDSASTGKDTGRDRREDGPARGVLAVANLQDVSRGYEARRAELDRMLRGRRIHHPEIQDLLARVLPHRLKRPA
ncbi:polyprenyl synthetase family protein [Paracoccus sp. (in: a-proteobacteria)]|uniref:polyprenyl synthetase family protein n=1 Tax=Paracoccus sp. TaxID=267 RepID=UPI00272A5881|nr:polyprenyl synthetase family protein [Paracoccus sp. (in: a-proteobacteria)]